MQSNNSFSTRRTFMRQSAALMAGTAVMPTLRAADAAGSVQLSDSVLVLNAGCNVLASVTADGVVLVDSGVSAAAGTLQSQLAGLGKVNTLFNTHWHDDQCGNNLLFGEQGATIIAHKKTQLHLGTNHYLPRQERYFTAYPEAALPTETIYSEASASIGGEQIDYGYLVQAHTDGDIYVRFRTANIIAVGDAVSPLLDPSFDWYGGGWIGGRIDSLDLLLRMSDEQTRIVPAYGPVIGKAEVLAERDLMQSIYDTTVELVRQGYSAQNMLDDGFMSALPRQFNDPYQFLYDLSKGLWAHHNKLSPNVV